MWGMPAYPLEDVSAEQYTAFPHSLIGKVWYGIPSEKEGWFITGVLVSADLVLTSFVGQACKKSG